MIIYIKNLLKKIFGSEEIAPITIKTTISEKEVVKATVENKPKVEAEKIIENRIAEIEKSKKDTKTEVKPVQKQNAPKAKPTKKGGK